MEDKLRQLLRELGRALAESSDASLALRRFQEEGYNLFLLLDRAASVPVPAGTAEESSTAVTAAQSVAAAPTTEPAFRIDLQDLRFLRSLGIDPTRRIRIRRRAGALRGTS